MGIAVAGCGSSSSHSSAANTSATTAANSGSSAGSSSGSVAPDMSYFKGKTITFIAPDKPGGSFDEWSRLLAPVMGQYLNATVNVENVPPGNTIVGQNQLAASSPDGLTIGWLNVGEDVADVVKGAGGINFSLSKVGIVGAPGFGQMVLVAEPNSPYKTFAELQKASGTVKSLDVTKGTGDTVERVLLGAYGINAKIITGYESSKDLAAGFLRGDGQIAEEELAVFQNAISAGKAIPLWVSEAVPSQNPVYAQMKSVPTLQQLIQSNPPQGQQQADAVKVLESITQVAQVVAAPPGVAAGKLAALQAAMKYAMSQPSVKAQALKESLVPTFYDAQQTTQALQTDQQDAQSLKPYLK
ncbi:MAG TPA: hypothetical protein VFN68_17355 [Acidimicrobiales bacterium]|nr:hypothetical protein [Acidimicrobiales bacterium]